MDVLAHLDTNLSSEQYSFVQDGIQLGQLQKQPDITVWF